MSRNAKLLSDDPNDVKRYVAGYVSSTMPAETWAQVGQDCRDVVSDSEPDTVRAAKERCTATAGFAAAMVELGVLTGDATLQSLLTEAMVDYYIERPDWDASVGTRGAYRTYLRIVGRAVNPEGWPARLSLPRGPMQPPVDDEDVESWLHTADKWPPLWKPRLKAAVLFALAVGAAPEDLRALHTEDVTVDGRDVTVTLTGLEPRTVQADPQWADDLVRLRRDLSGWVLTGSETPPTRNTLSELGSRTKSQCRSRLNIARLRTTCLLGWVHDDLPVDVLRYRTGLKTLRSIDNLLVYVDRDPAGWTPPPVALSEPRVTHPAVWGVA